DSNGNLNDVTPRVDIAKKVVSPSVVEETLEKEKLSHVVTTTESYPPLPTRVATSAGNAPGKSLYATPVTTAGNVSGKSSYANITGKPSGKKVNVRTLFTPEGNGIDVVVSVDSIRAISERFANTAYRFFLGKKVAYPVVANYEDVSTVSVWVKLYGVPVMAFSEDGLSAIATKLGTPLMLDSYTSYMCMQPWGRSSYVRVMIELRADLELKANIVVAMLKITREGHYICAGKKKTVKKPIQTSRGVLVGQKIDTIVPLQQELGLLFGHLYDEFFNAGTSSVNKSSFPTANSKHRDTPPTSNIQSSTEPTNPTNANAEENNDNQATHEYINPLCPPVHEVVESSSHNIGNSNVYTFNQPQVFEYRWTKDHPLEQVYGNPSKPVQTRRQLATDLEMYIFTLIVSAAEPKNIKKAMADSAWINAMQEELISLTDSKSGNSLTNPMASTRALYGLKQAPRAWYDELSQFLTSKGFTKGLQIHQSPRGIFINQAKYALGILKKHGMEKGQIIGTPMTTKPKLDADLSGNPVDQTDYRSKIRSLMYLTSSRPDIVQAVCYCARYQSRPTKKHFKEVKKIFRYLRGTIDMGLWYPKDSGFELIAFSDADHAGCIDTRKSTSGGIQFLGDKFVSWMSKKQDCTAMSSAEAKYVAFSASCAQIISMRTQLKDYGFNYNKIPLYCDS
nr:ribonuclease H-like domain-containing protein [Tanacetum cinerariifolium]